MNDKVNLALESFRAIDDTLTQQASQITAQQQIIDTYQTVIQNLQTENDGLQVSVDGLQSDNATLKTSLSDKEWQVDNLKTAIRILSKIDKGVSWMNLKKWGRNGLPPYNFTGMAFDAQDLANAGTSHVRTRVSEGDSFDTIDSFVSILTTHNLKWLVTLHKMFPTNDLGTSAQRDASKVYAERFIKRYGDYIWGIEIKNEPNIKEGWVIDYTTDATLRLGVQSYVTHLSDMYGVIHSIKPNIIVMNGGLSSGDMVAKGVNGTFGRYMDAFIACSGQNFIDAFAFHPYANTPDGCAATVKALNLKKATNPLLASKPNVFTEIGFTVTPNTSVSVPDATTQCAYIKQMFDVLRNTSNNLSPIFLYTAEDVNVSSNDGFSLFRRNAVTYDAVYTPAYDAFKEL